MIPERPPRVQDVLLSAQTLRDAKDRTSMNLSIENAPAYLVIRLQERARLHQRSLESELLEIIEMAVREDPPLSSIELVAETRRRGLETPSESAEILRADRDRN